MARPRSGDARRSLAVVMPVYNEADGILEFLAEIVEHFGKWELQIHVFDDESSDDTAAVVEQWAAATQAPVTLVRCAPNAGHGPTTIKALQAGLAADTDVVLAVDGDGQFRAAQMELLAQIASLPGIDVVEGVRTGRGDPLFRVITSFATRALVRLRAPRMPMDANTPLRAYDPAALRGLLAKVPTDAMTPNLMISALSRTTRLRIVQLRVDSLDRRGETAHGSTWGQRRKSLPTKRFLRFCRDATRQWIAWRG